MIKKKEKKIICTQKQKGTENRTNIGVDEKNLNLDINLFDVDTTF